jgi:hypothetical protein
MRDAGFSIIKNHKLFDDETVEYLTGLSKMQRNIRIGIMLRENQDVSKFIMEEFVRVREKFLKLNNVGDQDILSIKKDAIITVNKHAEHLKFDGYEFRNKHKYSSYFYLNGKEFYYSSWEDVLETKGFGKQVVEAHSEYFLNDIKSIMRQNEKLNQDQIVRVLKNYREKYLGLKLPTDCYRELSFENKFRLKDKIAGEPVFLETLQDEKLIERLDITYNYINYVIPLIGLIV